MTGRFEYPESGSYCRVYTQRELERQLIPAGKNIGHSHLSWRSSSIQTTATITESPLSRLRSPGDRSEIIMVEFMCISMQSKGVRLRSGGSASAFLLGVRQNNADNACSTQGTSHYHLSWIVLSHHPNKFPRLWKVPREG
jgi:hypothetical protein